MAIPFVTNDLRQAEGKVKAFDASFGRRTKKFEKPSHGACGFKIAGL
ncbi:MAG TPA: hypothetical protein VN112_03760 [Ensifer sp.]|nr:hypothetical protein [Ensifer sp.]